MSTSVAAIPVVTIDGPGGSGKGTVARRVHDRLGWHLLDSGALYRVLGLAAQRHGIDTQDELALAGLAHVLQAQFSLDDSAHEKVMLEGDDVTAAIRLESTGELASQVAAIQPVRAALLSRQRAFRKPPGLVADGRDMGTVVFPRAEVKVFLTASVEERARRRHKQLKEQGVSVNLSSLLEDIAERDRRDMSRSVAPLRPAADAEVIDSTGVSVEAVVEKVLELVAKRLGPAY